MKLVRFFAPIFALLALIACQSFNKTILEPRISLRSVDFGDITLGGIELITHVEIENPNSFTLPTPKFDWSVSINESPFTQGVYNSSKSIKKQEKITIDFLITIPYGALYKSFKSIFDSKEAAYNVALGISFPVSGLENKIFPLNYSGQIPLLQFPKLLSGSLGRTMGFELALEVDNKNPFAFDMDNFSYDFMVNNSQWAQGRINNPPRIKA